MKKLGHVDARYLTEVSRSTGTLKHLTYELMGAREGASLLDAGCGPGEDTLALAEIVGPDGRVTGVDSDKTLLRTARLRAKQAGAGWVDHTFATLPKLPFESATFDGARSERVFQHLPQPLESLREVVRVTKPGGRVVLMEPDWGTLIVDAGDRALERKILSAGLDRALKTGDVGRRVPGLFARCGLVERQVTMIPIQYANLASAQHFILGGFEDAARKVVSARDLTRWRTSLEQAEEEGRFFAAFNYVLVSGTVG